MGLPVGVERGRALGTERCVAGGRATAIETTLPFSPAARREWRGARARDGRRFERRRGHHRQAAFGDRTVAALPRSRDASAPIRRRARARGSRIVEEMLVLSVRLTRSLRASGAPDRELPPGDVRQTARSRTGPTRPRRALRRGRRPALVHGGRAASGRGGPGTCQHLLEARELPPRNRVLLLSFCCGRHRYRPSHQMPSPSPSRVAPHQLPPSPVRIVGRRLSGVLSRCSAGAAALRARAGALCLPLLALDASLLGASRAASRRA